MKQESITKQKYLMFVLCFVLVVSGIVLIIVGVNGANVGCNGCDVKEFLGWIPVTASRITMVSGVVIIVIPYLGCYGAIRENGCMVRKFGLLLFAIFVVETAGGLMAYAYTDQFTKDRMLTENFLKKNMDDSIAQQKVEIWEEVQQGLKCCGVSGHDDYLKNNITIPASCFNQSETYDGEQRFTADKAYKPGCYIVLVNEINDKITMVGTAAIIIGLIEAFGGMFTHRVFMAIKRRKGS